MVYASQKNTSIILSLLLLAGSALSLLGSGDALATERGEISGANAHNLPDWFKDSFLDIAEDVNEANDEDRHVMLFFHLTNCPYCNRMLTESFETDPLKSYIQDNFDVIVINIKGDREVAFTDEISVSEKALAEQLNVFATPAIMFLDKNNKAVALPVNIGERVYGKVQITTGLKAGDQIITKGQLLLKNGSNVKVAHSKKT